MTNRNEGKDWFNIHVAGRVVDCVRASSHEEVLEYINERWLPSVMRSNNGNVDINIIQLPMPARERIELAVAESSRRYYLPPIVKKDEEK